MDDEKIITDKEEALHAVQFNAYRLYYASNALKNDEEVILTACGAELHGSEAIIYASPQLRNNKRFVSEVLEVCPMALEHLDPIFQDDITLVCQAVTQDAYTLQFASSKLRNHKRLVLIALQQNEEAINYASDEIVRLIGMDNPLENMKELLNKEKFAKKLDSSLIVKDIPNRKIKI